MIVVLVRVVTVVTVTVVSVLVVEVVTPEQNPLTPTFAAHRTTEKGCTSQHGQQIPQWPQSGQTPLQQRKVTLSTQPTPSPTTKKKH